MIRRTFRTPEGYALCTYDPNTGEMYVSLRVETWDSWSPALPEVVEERGDDPVDLSGSRVYGADGRAYLLAPADDVVDLGAPLPDDVPAPPQVPTQE